MKKTIILLLTLCILLSSVGVITANAEEPLYTYDNNTKTLTINIKGKMKYSSDNAPWKDIEYPEQIILSKGITSISVYGFSGTPDTFPEGYWNYNHRIKSVKLPNTLKTIKDYAFQYCYSLEKINIPNSVKKLGGMAFMECKKLKTITIPGSVKNIPYSTFILCKGLKSVTMKKGVKTIGAGAFSECISLSKVKIPNSVTKIDYYAFDKCWSLKTLKLSKKLKEINKYAFCSCTKLKKIAIPKNIKKIGKKALGYRKSGEKIKGFTIKGYKGTAAEKYAKKNKFKFVALDK